MELQNEHSDGFQYLEQIYAEALDPTRRWGMWPLMTMKEFPSLAVWCGMINILLTSTFVHMILDTYKTTPAESPSDAYFFLFAFAASRELDYFAISSPDEFTAHS